MHWDQHLLLYGSWAVRPISQLARYCAKWGIRDVPAILLLCRILTTTRRLSTCPSAIVSGATCRPIPMAPSARLRLSTIAPRSSDYSAGCQPSPGLNSDRLAARSLVFSPKSFW